MSNKIIAVMLSVAMVVFALSKMNFAPNTVEGFWGNIQRQVKTFPVRKDRNGNEVGVVGNFVKPYLNNDQFVKTANYQAMLSPRFSNVNYGANIRYNLPDYVNQASPCNPLTFGDMAKEGYSSRNTTEPYCGSSGGVPTCGKAGLAPALNMSSEYPLPSSFASGNYGQVNDRLLAQSNSPVAVDELPVGTMNTIDSMGNIEQPVIYDRFVFANMKSRLRNQGDMIRGDLPIVPCHQEQAWFSVYPNINLDLQQGAMSVMGGVRNDTSVLTSQLIAEASGNTQKGGLTGMDLSNVNMIPQLKTQGSGAFGDISVTGFP